MSEAEYKDIFPRDLHLACRYGCLQDVVKCLAGELHCNLECTDGEGRTPLHLACRYGHLDVVKYLAGELHCNVECTDSEGKTPLFLACRYRHLDIMKYLAGELHCNVVCTDRWGRTPLYLACRFNSTNTAHYLLAEMCCDPNHQDKQGKTPLDLAYHTSIIKLLIRYGAETKHVYTKCGQLLPEHCPKTPAKAVVKTFVGGDVGAGKSTLTKALTQDPKGLSRVTAWLTKVSGVQQKTAGIIPFEVESDTLGRVAFYDLAGHKEFYASHDALLRNALGGSTAIFLLVADLSKSDEEFKETLLYWLSFVENQYASDAKAVHSHAGKPPSAASKLHVIVVGSHADVVRSSEKERKESLVQSLQPESSAFHFSGFVALDCRYSESAAMTKLRQYFAQSCESVRCSTDMSFRSHCFLIFLLDKFRDSPAVSMSEISAAVQSTPEEDETKLLSFIPASLVGLHKACEELNERGNILLLKVASNVENSWVVLDREALLSNVTGTIFAPSDFIQHQELATSTGVVPQSRLATHFPNLNPDMIAALLSHLEFCHEITDHVVLELLQATTCSALTQEKYFFFPALVSIAVPCQVWEPSTNFGYHSGWQLKCSRLEHVFLPRFLHVLLLRLAFSFALTPDVHEVTTDLPTLQRKCSVWKNGICWASGLGVEALVEVVERRVTVMVRCLKGREIECIWLRSRIIQKVQNARKEFCPVISTSEFLLTPQDSKEFPLKPTPELTTFSFATVTRAIITADPCIVCTPPAPPVPLEELLHFEPYAHLGEHILHKIFDDQNPDYHSEIKDQFLYRIAERVHPHKDSFVLLFKHLRKERAKEEGRDDTEELFTTRLHEHISMAPPGPTHELVRVLQLGSECTYCCLRTELDQFSVFAGRNPLEVAKTLNIQTLCTSNLQDPSTLSNYNN